MARETDAKVAALLAQPNWHEERIMLRDLILSSGLIEEIKWGKLCYTFEGNNVAIFYGLKAYCGIGFFKGALLSDPHGVLYSQGKNSQAVRMFRFTDTAQIEAAAPIIRAYLAEAIEIERSGQKIDFKQKHALEFPQELLDWFAQDPAFEAAFKALTPGRQRGYNLHFGGAKQSATRRARIEKCAGRIMEGKGMQDR
ncbi:MAG: YdeI/OmpD-associated family protein [Paracoccaceae bacterium]